jgi:hypothetical protein
MASREHLQLNTTISHHLTIHVAEQLRQNESSYAHTTLFTLYAFLSIKAPIQASSKKYSQHRKISDTSHEPPFSQFHPLHFTQIQHPHNPKEQSPHPKNYRPSSMYIRPNTSKCVRQSFITNHVLAGMDQSSPTSKSNTKVVQ